MSESNLGTIGHQLHAAHDATVETVTRVANGQAQREQLLGSYAAALSLVEQLQSVVASLPQQIQNVLATTALAGASLRTANHTLRETIGNTPGGSPNENAVDASGYLGHAQELLGVATNELSPDTLADGYLANEAETPAIAETLRGLQEQLMACWIVAGEAVPQEIIRQAALGARSIERYTVDLGLKPPAAM